MKKILLFALTLALIFSLSACGKEAAPTPTPAVTPTQTVPPPPAVTPTQKVTSLPVPKSTETPDYSGGFAPAKEKDLIIISDTAPASGLTPSTDKNGHRRPGSSITIVPRR